jgi:hypothetical protein
LLTLLLPQRRRAPCDCGGDLGLDPCHCLQGLIPSPFQFVGDKPIGWIDRIVCVFQKFRTAVS